MKTREREPEKAKLWRVKSTVSEFFMECETLDEAKILAKWNFLKGYEIRCITTNELCIRHEVFDVSVIRCKFCPHVRSEHHSEKEPFPCMEKKCQCKKYERL